MRGCFVGAIPRRHGIQFLGPCSLEPSILGTYHLRSIVKGETPVPNTKVSQSLHSLNGVTY